MSITTLNTCGYIIDQQHLTWSRWHPDNRTLAGSPPQWTSTHLNTATTSSLETKQLMLQSCHNVWLKFLDNLWVTSHPQTVGERIATCHFFSANSILLLILLLLLYYISMTMVNKYLSCQHSRHYAEEEPWSLDQQCSLTTTKKTQQTTILVSWCSCQQLHTTCAVMFSCVCWSWLLRKHVLNWRKKLILPPH